MPVFYPIFLSLENKSCLIAGMGSVGSRKLTGLLAGECGLVNVFEIRPICELDTATRQLLDEPRVCFHCRPCGREDIKSSLLVFAATNNKRENERIAGLCRQEKILCDCASNPSLSDFISPATARCGGMAAALSTTGQSPYLAGKWRKDLETWLAPRAGQAWLMGKLRALVLAKSENSGKNAELFRKIAEFPLAEFLASHRLEECRSWLLEELPFCQAEELDKIFVEYRNAFR